jgi:serine/threonine-protein kinase
VHRDIKPGNLLITPDNRVKITDFGIARIADQVPLTATGQVMGTVQYLSPEQASGHPASPTTDIYSLGIVAYEALAGRRPFTGESQVAIAMAQINETPPELPATVSEPVRNLVYSCLAKSPADRPASAAHLARAAQSLRRGDIAAAATAVPGILGEGSLAGTVGANYGLPTASTRVLSTTDTRPVEVQRRHPWTWPLIAIVSLLGVVLIGAVIALLANPAEQPVIPTPTFTTPAITPTPSLTPTTAPIVLVEADFVGLTQNQARAKLEDLGLQMEVVVGSVAPTIEDVDRAYRINPQGNVQKNAIIAVSFYAPIPQPSKPAAVSVQGTPPFAVNSTVTVTWPNYGSCPAGHPLTGYSFEISNGAMQGATNPVGAGVTSLDITLPLTAGTTTVSYFVFCSELQSSISDSVTITSK